MVSAIERKERNMATDAIASDEAEPGGERPRTTTETPARGTGFFHVYKRGQGYLTRMGSAAAAALLAALTIQFLYSHLNIWLRPLFEQPNVPEDQRGIMIAHAQSM